MKQVQMDFEEWIKPLNYNLEKDADNCYFSTEVQDLWSGWEAAAHKYSNYLGF